MYNEYHVYAYLFIQIYYMNLEFGLHSEIIFTRRNDNRGWKLKYNMLSYVFYE